MILIRWGALILYDPENSQKIFILIFREYTLLLLSNIKHMILKKKDHKTRITIDLTSSEGNAFVLLAHARNLSKQLGNDPDPIIEEMQSGDYEHLIQVFDREFGEYVDLLR